MKRLYVVVREDLNDSYKAVQACHAVGEFMKIHPGVWSNEVLVVLKTNNELMLRYWFEQAVDKTPLIAPFFEPDLPNCPMTAFAASGKIKGLFRGLALL